VPLFNMQVFTRVLTTRDFHTLIALAGGLAVGLASYVVLDQLRARALDALAERAARRLALPVLRAAAAARRGTEAQALHDVETLRAFLGSSACTAPFDLAWAPVLVGVLLAMHWGFAVLATIGCLLLAALNAIGDALARRQLAAANQQAAEGLRDVAGAVRCAEAVVAMGMVPALAVRWRRAQRLSSATAHTALLRARAVHAVIRALRLAMTAAMVTLGLVLALNGLAASGAMIASNMMLGQLLQPFERISGTRRQWADVAAAWQRLRALLETAVPVRHRHPLPVPQGRLVVERLVWIAPGSDRPALRGVSFTLDPGEVLGVIGPSGAGKSTLLRLLAGMTAPTAGGAYLDGTSTFLWEREDFARHVGYVPQGLALTDTTVAGIIARLQTPDMAAVIAAARRVDLHRTIAALPQGYATKLSGFVLSAGQRQRLALARALYTRPRLLLLDEPSAFLDVESEAVLTGLLRTLAAEGTSTVVASHRPTLVAAADKLMMMREGLVDRFGTRESVLEALQAPAVEASDVQMLRDAREAVS
jgi:ATP-binding cassette subfamily C protein